jgi:hypothetical protein
MLHSVRNEPHELIVAADGYYITSHDCYNIYKEMPDERYFGKNDSQVAKADP